MAEFTIPPALMLRDRNILLRSTAVTPEIKGFTRAPVLRRGGRTDRGLAPGVDRGSCKYIGPFPSLLDEWGGLEGAFRSTVPRSEGLGSYVLCGSREANEGKLFELSALIACSEQPPYETNRKQPLSVGGSEASTTALVLLLAKRLLCFSRACLREGEKSFFSLGPKASVKAKDLIQQKSRILSAADMRLRLGDHIMP
ncbi:hypothetical protein G4B88_002359 (mitochondrion) [Cannabis sativa]|uniref:Uncharacterized protein n=1 Tax=Cannabis sativa TaxID=3483 RepID=A0A7J6DV10_CANSA|nr:hypothetical protein G4B88_002359 [Cannabis sativa]